MRVSIRVRGLHLVSYFLNLSSINPTSIKLNLIYIIPISVKLDSAFIINFDRLGNSIREISPYQVSLHQIFLLFLCIYNNIYVFFSVFFLSNLSLSNLALSNLPVWQAMPSRFFGGLYCARQEGFTCGVIQSFNLICSAFSEDLKGSVHTLYAFLPPIQHVVSAHIFISHMVFRSPAYSSQFNTCSSGCPYLYSKCNVNANYSNL